MSVSHDHGPGDGSPGNIGVTVASLLDEDLFEGTLVGGRGGSTNLVAWCLPFVAPGARGPAVSLGDLNGAAICVSFAQFPVRDVGKVVRRLAEDGVAMLVITCNNTEEERDLVHVIEAADEVGLPLLAVGSRVTFREASRLIATKVLAQETHVLEYGVRVHRILGDVFARGAGLTALAQTMAQLSDTTVLIVGNNAELLAEGSPRGGRHDLAPGAADRIVELLATTSRTDNAGPELAVEVIALDIDGDPVQVVLAPVQIAGGPYGLLILVEPSCPAPPHALAQHKVMVEQGVSLTGSELLRMQSVREAEERARNDFVHALLHGRFTDQLELVARAEHYQLPVDGRFAVFIVTTPALKPEDASAQRIGREAERAVQSVVSDDLSTLTAVVGSMVVVVRQMRSRRGPDRDPAQVTQELKEFGAQLHRAMRQRLWDDVRVSFGRPFNGATGVAMSYREARTAEGLARRVQTDEVCSYADLRVFAAIEEAATSAAGQSFAAEMLAPLKQMDGQSGNLEELVLAYIEESGNLNAAARRLHLHRNTMLYKLERASRALQMDVRSTEAQFMIWLAHHITALNDVVASLDEELSPPS
ncbi:helix-turn-helix domain-containing protein [Nocardioides sp.]|uniref:helix-turn-helix domain-containing protein n=1 Tax=Nocardioides sp. TaxID=35761 RepID=UPI0027375E60|nr:helix-turn-helix domain-containing protein [Nocardioides sp.]MDP3891633.1 helix-turn-helix domain-containing protein [Nocardioides sp.]